MKILGQPIALMIAAALLLLLACTHPLVWLQARNAASASSMNTGEQGQLDPAARYVAMLSESAPLRAALRGHKVIGYVSESDIDVRTDGSGQKRYYLTQFALAPVLVELDADQEHPRPAHDFVLAAFQSSQQLSEYLRKNARVAIVSLNASIALTRARDR